MPRVQTTPITRAALWLLLVYVVVMLTLIGVKFVRALTGHEPQKTAAVRVIGPES